MKKWVDSVGDSLFETKSLIFGNPGSACKIICRVSEMSLIKQKQTFFRGVSPPPPLFMCINLSQKSVQEQQGTNLRL